jgi:hypothetical protein
MPERTFRIGQALAKWATTLACLLFLQMVPVAGASAATLPELFPGLADLPDARTVVIELGWQGLSPLSPVEANYRLELRDGQFEGKGRFKVASATATRDIVVPRDLMRAFLAAATRVALVEKKYQPRITHTDDYPTVTVAVQTKQGNVTIATRSQPQKSASGNHWDSTPWAIDYSGRTFVVTSEDLDQALDPLWTRLQYDEVTGELAKQIRP